MDWDFVSYEKERDSLIISTISPTAFVLKEFNNGGIFDFMWHVLFLHDI